MYMAPYKSIIIIIIIIIERLGHVTHGVSSQMTSPQSAAMSAVYGFLDEYHRHGSV